MGLLDLAWPVLLACAAALLGGGITKGTTGIGLPLVAVPVLATFIPAPQAVALLTIPSVLSNIYQTFAGGYFFRSIRRVWILILGLAIGVPIGARMLLTVDLKLLDFLLGTFITVFSSALLYRADFRVPPRLDKPLGLVAGTAAGVVGGLSMFFGPVYALYLTGLGLRKDAFVAAVSLANLSGAAFLTIALAGGGALGAGDAAVALAASLPVAIGVWIGQTVRARINELLFRRTLAVVLFLIGLNLIRKGIT